MAGIKHYRRLKKQKTNKKRNNNFAFYWFTIYIVNYITRKGNFYNPNPM